MDDLLESYMGIRDTELGEFSLDSRQDFKPTTPSRSESCSFQRNQFRSPISPLQPLRWLKSAGTRRTRTNSPWRSTRPSETSLFPTSSSLTCGGPSETPSREGFRVCASSRPHRTLSPPRHFNFLKSHWTNIERPDEGRPCRFISQLGRNDRI